MRLEPLQDWRGLYASFPDFSGALSVLRARQEVSDYLVAGRAVSPARRTLSAGARMCAMVPLAVSATGRLNTVPGAYCRIRSIEPFFRLIGRGEGSDAGVGAARVCMVRL